MKYYSRISLLALLAVIPFNGFSQEREVPIKYGDMEQWVTRKIHESSIIGGNTRLLYEIAPTQEVDGNVAYENMGGSPWGTSNVMAKVMGLSKLITRYIRKNVIMAIVPAWRRILKE